MSAWNHIDKRIFPLNGPLCIEITINSYLFPCTVVKAEAPPSLATEAVLVKSEGLPEGTETIRGKQYTTFLIKLYF